MVQFKETPVQIRHLGVLLLLGAVWGTSFLFIKIGVAELPPELLVTGRLIIAATCLVTVLYVRGLRLPTQGRVWRDFLFVGIVGVVLPFWLITWGEQTIPSGMAAILNGTTPLFTALLAYIGTREERLSGLRLLGIGIGFIGVLVAVGINDLSLTNTNTLGELAVLVAALCYGISGLYGRRAFRGLPALLPATGQILTGALVITPLALAAHGIPSAFLSFRTIGAVVGLALFGTVIAYILFYWLIERIGATRTSMVTYLLPPFALVYGTLLLGEPITWRAVIGLLLVIIGILLTNGVLPLRAKQMPQLTTDVSEKPAP